jgi:putative ABC transport system permease protein
VQHNPPRLAKRILLSFLKDELAEEVTGDLEEKFLNDSKHSARKARWNYWLQVFQYLRPFAIRNFRYLNPLIMYRHNFLLSIRNFRRYKSSFFINVIGLSTGLACTLMIYLWVSDELAIDKFHENDTRLYRVMSNHTDAGGIFTWDGTPGLLVDEVRNTVPEVRLVTTSSGIVPLIISAEGKRLTAPGQFVGEDFFRVFTFPLMQGDPKKVLADKMNIVISSSLAGRLFSKHEQVIGKAVDWEFNGKKITFYVSGVFADVPENSSEKFDFAMSFDYFEGDVQTYVNWYNYYAHTSVVLRDDADAGEVSRKIDAVFKAKGDSARVDLFLQPYSDKYLYGRFENGKLAGGRIDYVRLFSVIAIFILVIACINFMNLSTARASRRIKEIGVKKSLGAKRASLIGQYYLESMLISFLSAFIAVGLVAIALPFFNVVTQKQLAISIDANLLGAFFTTALVTGFLAGSYPALYLSGFNPTSVLKGKLDTAMGELWARKGLVVFQFTLSIILIVAVVVVYKQIDFVQSTNLGYNKDNLVYFERDGRLAENAESFIQELKAMPGVINASTGKFKPGYNSSTGGIGWEGKTDKDQIQFGELRSGYEFPQTLGVQLVSGRFFSREFQDDSASIIFNESAIRAMGMTDPVGKKITHYQGDRIIVGVVKDFTIGSLHEKIGPVAFLCDPDKAGQIFVRTEPGMQREILTRIEKLYKKFNPDNAFNYEFVDSDYRSLYESELRVATLSKAFAGFAILISCLGLFGLAAFSAERRKKEIGIRKVLGSSEAKIVMLLSADFTKMVVVSILIAIPVSYLAAEWWLNNFAYHIEPEWWFFASAGAVALTIAWLTVGLHTVRAARINPATCLKYE